MKIDEFVQHIEEEVDRIARDLGLNLQGSLEEKALLVVAGLSAFGFREQAIEYITCHAKLLQQDFRYPDVAGLAAWAYLLAAQHRRDHSFEASEGFCGGVRRFSPQIGLRRIEISSQFTCEPPNCAPMLSDDVYMEGSSDGTVSVSNALVDLLVCSRSTYAWPANTSAPDSQRSIVELEEQTQERVGMLNEDVAYLIARDISRWGGLRSNQVNQMERANREGKTRFATPIRKLLIGQLRDGLKDLSEQPGVCLIMATKIYRFCCPASGAALDRHCTYFFNSLGLHWPDGTRGTCTEFRREWSNAKHRNSRLAVYSKSRFEHNLDEYLDRYLPLVTKIADCLNREGIQYTCAATSEQRGWRPADVEMAAYQWWSRNGAR